MTATAHVAYDWVFVAHVMVAVATIVVLVALRVAARATFDDPASGPRRFPDRVDWALRIVHLLPASGVALVAMGGADVSIGHLWVQAGIGCYVVVGAWIEIRVAPLERALARILVTDVDPRRSVATLMRSLDVALLVITVAMVTMIVQF